MAPGTTVKFIGKCSTKLHRAILAANQAHSDKLSFEGVGYSVPFDEIRQSYEGNWLAGLAIFPHNEHLERKELTKFFEYMLYGIPVITSDFSTWRSLIEDHQCGICVDPRDEAQIADAIRTLQNDHELWSTMSRNGMECVRKEFSWSSQEEVLLDVYREAVEKLGCSL